MCGAGSEEGGHAVLILYRHGSQGAGMQRHTGSIETNQHYARFTVTYPLAAALAVAVPHTRSISHRGSILSFIPGDVAAMKNNVRE